jgi:hypothetical protein
VTQREKGFREKTRARRKDLSISWLTKGLEFPIYMMAFKTSL